MKQQIVTKAVLWDGEQATEYVVKRNTVTCEIIGGVSFRKGLPKKSLFCQVKAKRKAHPVL